MPTDSNADLPLHTILEQLVRPARTLKDSWERQTLLESAARDLIARGRAQDVVQLALSVADAHQLDSYVSDTCANVLQWASWERYDAYITQRTLALAERGRFAFSFAMSDMVANQKPAPFFIGAFMPKSGGTYISSILKRSFGYNTDVYYIFGGDVDNMISPARASVLAVTGGVHNHSHVSPSAWNLSILRQLRVPVWIHIRDPRDAFLSLLHMTEKERERGGPEAEAFYMNLESEIGPASPASSLGLLATRLYTGFELYCNWVSRWLGYDYGPKLLTQHADLAHDELAFFRTAATALGIDAMAIDAPPKTYADTRFFKGTNGRWKTELEAPLVARMRETMARLGLLEVFAEG